ncbi:hypothetical protein ABHI18_012545, partial [Aspergillus niger]
NLIQAKHGIKISVDLEYCFKLLLKRIRIAVVDLAFPSITLSNCTVDIRPMVVFANDESKVLVSGGNYKQLNDSSVQWASGVAD